MTGPSEATVITLTAEVRTLMLGSRQVTLGVFSQLDEVNPEDVIPFGRVSPPGNTRAVVWVVGKHRTTGALVRSSYPLNYEGRQDFIVSQPGWEHHSGLGVLSPEMQDDWSRLSGKYRGRYQIKDEGERKTAEQEFQEASDGLRTRIAQQYRQAEENLEAKAAEWLELPLIVLAGLGLK